MSQHPDADKLYVITLDAGNGEERTICSGLVESYKPEELDGQTIVLAYNLKPAKLRGVRSEGMLLAAEDEQKNLEVIMPDAEPGQRVLLEGAGPAEAPSKRISIDRFFQTPILVEEGRVTVDGIGLVIGSTPLKTSKVLSGRVG